MTRCAFGKYCSIATSAIGMMPVFRGCFGHLAILGYRLESNSLVDVRSAGEAEPVPGSARNCSAFIPESRSRSPDSSVRNNCETEHH